MAVVLKTRGAPGPNTFGNVGDIRIDIDTHNVYRCVRVVTDGEEHGFVTIYSREGVNVTYEWELVAAEEAETYILIDEAGNEVPAVFVESETVFTAGPNDIREGMVAATDDGVTVGTKEIPAYITTEGLAIVPAGGKFVIPMPSHSCDYTKFQALVCDFNTNFDDSVSTSKVSIGDKTYNVNSTEVLADVKSDPGGGVIDLGITNEGSTLCIIRYFTYKEEY